MREAKGPINVKSLKEQVYDYLRRQFQAHRLQPGTVINMEATAKKLGVSKTPLRDALVQLEMEGFVTISPRRGIFVRALPLAEIREFYQVIGALESSALQAAFPKLGAAGIKRMDALNRQMQKAIDRDDFDLFYEKNLLFHNCFIELCGNKTLMRIIGNLKKRLYDFPQPAPVDQGVGGIIDTRAPGDRRLPSRSRSCRRRPFPARRPLVVRGPGKIHPQVLRDR